MRYRVFPHSLPKEIEAPDKETAQEMLLEMVPGAIWLLPITESPVIPLIEEKKEDGPPQAKKRYHP